MATGHFKNLSQRIAEIRNKEHLIDARILTQQNPVSLHKIILKVFSSHIWESKKNIQDIWEVSAMQFSQTDIGNLVDFLYNGETEIGNKMTEIIEVLKLDLRVDENVRTKKLSANALKQNLNLELKYLRNLVFEMEIPKLLTNPKPCSDVTICVERKRYLCHKVIIAAMSVYFETMFMSGMKEESDKVISLQGIEAETFSLVLHFIYTGNVSLTVSNAQDTLSVAVYLQVETLQNICEEFLLTQLDTTNCVDMWKLGSAYNCCLLTEGAWVFCVENFSNINRLKLQRNLNVTDIQSLLQEENLNIDDEKRVLQFVLDWVVNNNKSADLATLLPAVHLSLVDKSCIEHLLQTHKLFQNNESNKNLMQNTIKDQKDNTSSLKPRKEKTFIVVKRSSEFSGIEVGCYSLSQKKWFKLESMVHSPGGTGFSACAAVDTIYMSGGTSTPYSFYQYSVSLNKWSQLPDMGTARHSHATGYVDGLVYVLGGSGISSEAFTVVPSIEQYDIKNASWKTVANMDIPTYDSAYAVIKSRIYVFGGSIGNLAGIYIKDVQCFDTVTNTCTKIYHSLRFTLSLAVACSVHRDVYITCPDGRIIHFTEDSSPTTLSNNKGSQLMGFATLCHENAIYIMGGYSLIGQTDAVHKFDLKTKRQMKMSHVKLPFQRQTNQLFACAMHVSRKFLTNEYDNSSVRKSLSKRP